MGRDVLASFATKIAGDPGDPVLTAATLAWNAKHVPWTDAWFNFPGFHPVRDVLTFSENLLGLSPIASPLLWLTGSPIAAYNATMLATFVLCGLAMYALVWRLTRNPWAACLAGLAYAFAPYRVAHIPHIQVLASFWAPLALLGLHAYLETDRRRWLALFGVSWFMQATANGYFLVFFSLLIGLWGLWFVVAQRRWRQLVMIAAAGIAALVPLAPILWRYVQAHDRYGLSRNAMEIAGYSADISALFCAPVQLSAWGWVGENNPVCGSEQQLFPGVALVVIGLGAALLARRSSAAERGTPGSGLGDAASPPLEGRAQGRTRGQVIATVVSGLLLVIGLVMVLSAASVAIEGPWRRSIGPFVISASSVAKPFGRGLLVLLLGALCLPALWAGARTASIAWFYGLAAAVTWILSWGPTPMLGGKAALAQGPYAWLMLLPGLDGLRVPARFWMMTILCLCILLGLAVARASLPRSLRVFRPVLMGLAIVALLSDGWTPINAAALMPAPPRPDVLGGGVVLTLPLGGHRDSDIQAQFDAAVGGWSAVNGYSGYEPLHYNLLRYAAERRDPLVLTPFLGRGDLNVVAYESQPMLIEMVERMPGAVERGRGSGLRQYWIPKQGVLPPSEPRGRRLAIATIATSCNVEAIPAAQDGDPATRWQCGPQRPTQEMTVDLGTVQTVGMVVPALGPFTTDFPRRLIVETSTDGSTWQPAWDGGYLPQLVEAMLRDPLVNRVVLPFDPRAARYVRFRLADSDEVWYWSIAELEIWSGQGET